LANLLLEGQHLGFSLGPGVFQNLPALILNFLQTFGQLGAQAFGLLARGLCSGACLAGQVALAVDLI